MRVVIGSSGKAEWVESESAEVAHAPSTKAADVPSQWTDWLNNGWHKVKAADWAERYLPTKLEADLSFLAKLVDTAPDYGRMAQRMQREVVGDLIRMQHVLPWHTKKRPQFFKEKQVDLSGELGDREHAFPVSQVKSLVLMAIVEGDFDQAYKRLIYCWLIPTVLCTNATHRKLPARCDDFRYPYKRYASIGRLNLWRFDGVEINPAHYDVVQLLNDLSAVEQLRSTIIKLNGLILPLAQAELQFTKKMVGRQKA